MPVRLTICAFMTNPANAFQLFNQLLPNVPNLTRDSAVNRMKMHLLDKKLDQFGTWATETEIFVAATVFQLKIHVSVLLPCKKRSCIHLNHFFIITLATSSLILIYICFIQMQEIITI